MNDEQKFEMKTVNKLLIEYLVEHAEDTKVSDK